VEYFVRRNHVLDAGNRLAMIGRAPRRDQHVLRFDGFAIGEAKRVGAFQNCAGLDDVRAGLFDIRSVDALQPGNLLVLVGHQRRPVERRRGYRPSEARGVRNLVMNVRSEYEQFFRNAAPDHAGAAHPALFGNHDPRAMAGSDPGGPNAARTSSNDEQIDVELSHINPEAKIEEPMYDTLYSARTGARPHQMR